MILWSVFISGFPLKLTLLPVLPPPFGMVSAATRPSSAPILANNVMLAIHFSLEACSYCVLMGFFLQV